MNTTMTPRQAPVVSPTPDGTTDKAWYQKEFYVGRMVKPGLSGKEAL